MAHSPKAPVRRSDTGLFLIAALKLVNGLALLAIGLAGLSLINANLYEKVSQWADQFSLRSENQFLQRLIEKAQMIQPYQITLLSIVTLVYAGTLLTMGVGLLLRQRWAEYLTLIVAASFVPFEIYELIKRIHFGTILLLAINIASVIYLWWKLKRRE